MALPRGDVTEGVVRVGGTVRRPHQPQSLAVAGYLDHLELVGFAAAPRYLGRDGRGRDVLTFLPGEVPADPPDPWAADAALLRSVARLLRALHDASDGYLAADGLRAPHGSTWGRDLLRVPDGEPDAELPDVPELVSHCDVTPQNVVTSRGVAVGLVDFDLAGPTTRLQEVVNTAGWWAPLRPAADVWPTWRGVDQIARLAAFADAYDLDASRRAGLVDAAIRRARSARVRMRLSAEQFGGGWARMWEAGVGDAIARREAWLEEQRPALDSALHG